MLFTIDSLDSNGGANPPLRLRGIPTGLFFTVIVLAASFLGASLWAFSVLSRGDGPEGMRIVIIAVYLSLFVLPAFLIALCACCHYFTWLVISGGKVEFSRPFRKRVSLDAEEITVFGYASYDVKNAKIFFCTADVQKIRRFLAEHPQKCIQVWGRQKAERLQTTEAGRWQLAVGTYLACRPRDTWFLNYGSEKRLAAVVSALGRDGLITGPWAVEYQERILPFAKWEKE